MQEDEPDNMPQAGPNEPTSSVKWRKREYKQAQKRGIECFKKGEVMVKTRPEVVRRVPRNRRAAGDPRHPST